MLASLLHANRHNLSCSTKSNANIQYLSHQQSIWQSFDKSRKALPAQ